MKFEKKTAVAPDPVAPAASEAPAPAPPAPQPKPERSALQALRFLVGRRVRLETSVGAYRTGLLTGVRTRKLRLGSTGVELPEALVFDRDESDAVALAQIVALDVIS